MVVLALPARRHAAPCAPSSPATGRSGSGSRSPPRRSCRAGTGVDMRRGPAGEVDDDPRQRLVERRVGMGEALDAAPFAQRLVERLAERQRGVLDGVVVVDLEIALQLRSRSKRPCLASAVSMWSRKPRPVATSARPVPSRFERDPIRGLGGGVRSIRGRCADRRAHGTICAMSTTTMSVPPRGLDRRGSGSAGRRAARPP